MITKARLICALHDAFQAGVEQGEDEGIAWEHGQPPRQSRNEAFENLFAVWETGHDAKSHIKKALRKAV